MSFRLNSSSEVEMEMFLLLSGGLRGVISGGSLGGHGSMCSALTEVNRA